MKFLLSIALVLGLATVASAHGGYHGGGYSSHHGGYRGPVGVYRPSYGGVRIGVGIGGYGSYYGPYYSNPYYNPYYYGNPYYPYGVRPGVGIYIR